MVWKPGCPSVYVPLSIAQELLRAGNLHFDTGTSVLTQSEQPLKTYFSL